MSKGIFVLIIVLLTFRLILSSYNLIAGVEPQSNLKSVKCKIENGNVNCPNVKPGQTISCTGSSDNLECEVNE